MCYSLRWNYYGYANKSKVKGLFVVTFITILVESIRMEKIFSNDRPENINLSPKLIILLLDGFRWDYNDMHKHHLTGFQQFLESGLQVEYVQPIFPSLSLPSWATIATGLYPSHHNILGNHMLHRADGNLSELIFNFKDNASFNLKYWWKWAEPLWTTATKMGHKVYMADWGSCEVPFEGILPEDCTGYKNDKEIYHLREQLVKTIRKFQTGYSLAMIYFPHVDHVGHEHGPNSVNLLTALLTVDVALQELLYNLEFFGLHKQVNIVITSDHGMTSSKLTDGMVYVKLANYINNLDDIYKIIGFGSFVQIAVERKEKIDSLIQQLSLMPGVDAYKREDIPDEFHYKTGQHIQDILLVARPNHFIVGLEPGEKQLPSDRKVNLVEPCAGTHGYYNLTDMRSIFFARGPAFKKGVVHPPISLEDQYQVFTHILRIPPCEHNGTWDKVKDMFTVAK